MQNHLELLASLQHLHEVLHRSQAALNYARSCFPDDGEFQLHLDREQTELDKALHNVHYKLRSIPHNN